MALAKVFDYLTDVQKKVRVKMSVHDPTYDPQNKTWSVKPLNSCALSIAMDANLRKTKNFTNENIAGLLDCVHLRNLEKGHQGQKIMMYHQLVYWERTNKLYSDYPRLRVTRAVSFVKGNLNILLGTPPPGPQGEGANPATNPPTGGGAGS